MASKVPLMVKNPAVNAGDIRDTGSIPGSGRSPGEGNGSSFQYSGLENLMDRGAWCATVHGVAQSWTWVKGLNTQRREKERVWENFWRDYSWTLSQVGKGNSQFGGEPMLSFKINQKRNTPRHILIKLNKIKHKEKRLKAAREKQQVTHKWKPIWLTGDLSAETLQARREWQDIFKVLKGKKIYNQY